MPKPRNTMLACKTFFEVKRTPPSRTLGLLKNARIMPNTMANTALPMTGTSLPKNHAGTARAAHNATPGTVFFSQFRTFRKKPSLRGTAATAASSTLVSDSSASESSLFFTISTLPFRMNLFILSNYRAKSKQKKDPAIFSYRGAGVSAGARTRTEGVGGLYGIQFHHGHKSDSAILLYQIKRKNQRIRA